MCDKEESYSSCDDQKQYCYVKIFLLGKLKVVMNVNDVFFFFCIMMLSAGENRDNGEGLKKSLLPIMELGCIACAVISACTLTLASPVIAANQVSHIMFSFSIEHYGKNLDSHVSNVSLKM